MRNVLEHLGCDDVIELRILERQGQRVADLRHGTRAARHLGTAVHRLEGLRHRLELARVLVERDHIGATAVHLEGVPTRAASHVQHMVAGTHPEPVEVNRDHASESPSSSKIRSPDGRH